MDEQVDVVVVGAGFAGLYLLHELKGRGLAVQVIEAGSGVGGTWYWNRYPGARCDVPSMEYSYGFDDDLQQEWNWTERYSTQPEILSYLEHCASRFDLHDNIEFDTRVLSSAWDETAQRWTTTTDTGHQMESRFVVMATGCLSSTTIPPILGLDDFAGDWYHTGQWPHEGVDVSGKRVAVIGTGSSAVQSIPLLANDADEVTVFQRTATYVVPAWNRPLDAEEIQEIKDQYSEVRKRNQNQNACFGYNNPEPRASAVADPSEVRDAWLEEWWQRGGLGFLGSYSDLLINPAANELASEFVRDKIRSVVDDPATAELLCPPTQVGCKRMCVGTGYYETYNRDNVHLVSVADTPIDEITPRGVRVGDQEYEVDVIVFATGFDAMTGTLLKMDIRGRNGLTIQEEWSAGPLTYLGLGIHGFPNLFTISGPGSPSVLTNMVVSIEQHVRFVADAIGYLDDQGFSTIEADRDAVTSWVDYVNLVASFTIFPQCNSWYLGANVPGKTRVFMPLPGFPPYAEKCRDVVAKGYEGFVLTT